MKQYLAFHISKHDEIFNVVVNNLGFEPEVFATDDVIVVNTESEADDIIAEFPRGTFDVSETMSEFIMRKSGMYNPEYIDHNGVEYASQKRMCDAYHVSPTKFKNRRKAGWSLEEALTGVRK